MKPPHPVKEIVWALQGTGGGSSGYGALSYSKAGFLDMKDEGTIQLKLNNQDRFKERSPHYFTRTQIYEHHIGSPSFDNASNRTGAASVTKTTRAVLEPDRVSDIIGVYSFALKPEEHQPSGTCNFSRIDNSELEFKGIQINEAAGGDADGNAELYVYAVNYNVLRIMSGMGGLAYSN